jgi:adenosylmethionine-8-amino-7-oxononanoate aminotransferase
MEELADFSADAVQDARVLGAIGVVELREPGQARGAQAFAAERGVWLRPLDQFVYTMPPYTIGEDELRRICTAIKDYARSL